MEPEDRGAGRLIGELAELAGVTARTVRHYHAIGLLAEPPRDASGYRRYGPAEVVRLVMVRRLRDVGMPLADIQLQLTDGSGSTAKLPAALDALADDIDRQVASLRSVQARLRELASAGNTMDPAAVWSAALAARGVLAEASSLPESERQAVSLLDALHVSGVAGALRDAAPVMDDPERSQRLGALLRRFQRLEEDEVESLAGELSAVFPRPTHAPASVDLALMDRLVGDRLTPAQRRCIHRVRELLLTAARPGIGSE
jgi:DNA-binding transcriptional MerR regulator